MPQADQSALVARVDRPGGLLVLLADPLAPSPDYNGVIGRFTGTSPACTSVSCRPPRLQRPSVAGAPYVRGGSHEDWC